jgi:hypothetical protein
MSQVFALPPNAYMYSISNINRTDPTENAYDFHATFVNGSTTSLGSDSYSVSLKSCLFMNLIPNINKYNNQLSITFNGSTYTYVFPSNNYDVNAMLTALNGFFYQVSATFTTTAWSYNSTSKLLTLTLPQASTIIFNRPVTASQGVQNSYNYRTSVYDRCLDWLGLIPNANLTYTSPAGSASTVVATNPINLYGTSYVDVTIPNQVGCVHMAPLGKSLLARIPVQVQYGQLQYYEPTVQHSFPLSASDLDNLHVTLYDAWGWPLDTVPLNAQMSLKLILIPLNQD